MTKKRNYVDEYREYQGTPEQIKNRSTRNKARRAAVKAGMNVAGKDVDHIKPLSKGGASTPSNLRAVSATANRSFSRNKDGSLKSQRSKSGK